MSDEQREDEIEVEGHGSKAGLSEEPADETETEAEVEAHVQRVASVRMDSPSNS
jgi:hypothetical protein